MSERLGNVAYERDARGFLTGAEHAASAPRERDYARGDRRRPSTTRCAPSWTRVWSARSTLLRERRDVLERTARRLLEKETLDEAELLEFAGRAADQAAAQRRATAAE